MAAVSVLRSSAIAAVAAGVIGMATAAAAAGSLAHPADGFQPHRALYAMELTSSHSSLEIGDLKGLLGLTWENACEGFTFNEWMVTQVFDTEGNSFTSDVRSTTWEARDKRDYGFRVTDRTNGELTDQRSGKAIWAAAKAAGALGGRIEFDDKASPAIDLPPGTVFPTMHLALIVEAAKAGEPSLSLGVFDPAGEARVYHSIAQIRPLKGDVKPLQKALEGLPGWQVVIAYYDVDVHEELPEYEVSLRVFENGVIDQLDATYTDEMTIRAILKEYQPLPKPKC